MARNPMLQAARDAANTGALQGVSINDAYKRYIQGKHRFPMNYQFGTTLRFADATPFFHMNCIGADRVPYANKHLLRSFTLSAPMMQKFQMHKGYYAVDLRAIMPNTYEFQYKQPLEGDDVPEDAHCLANLGNWISTLYDNLNNYAGGDLFPSDSNFEDYVNTVLALESLCSRGSLFSCLGLPLRDCIVTYSEYDPQGYDIDDYVDKFAAALFDLNLVYRVQYNEDEFVQFCLPEHYQYWLNQGYDRVNLHAISRHDLLDYLRQYGCTISSSTGDPLQPQNIELPNLNIEGDKYFDVARFFAYQMIGVSMYTDDAIDPIYTAKLYRNLIKSVFGWYGEFFTYNASPIEYDTLSRHYFDKLNNQPGDIISFLRYMATFFKSLRFEDYLTGARSVPYAKVNTKAPITGDGVNALDINASLWRQRFANQVSRIGQKIENYQKMLTGKSQLPDPSEPKFLSYQTFDIDGYEVDNTGSDQREPQTVTKILKTSDQNFVFTCDVDSPMIIIGLVTFSLKRFYSSVVDRDLYHKDRYDWFNKFFQYEGDQKIRRDELSVIESDLPFAYTLRYMEYKQRNNCVAGGFIKGLPGFLSVWSRHDDQYTDALKISPEFIRNHNGDADRFYSSLTGYSLGTYFHFICLFTNFCKPWRAMEVAPTPL